MEVMVSDHRHLVLEALSDWMDKRLQTLVGLRPKLARALNYQAIAKPVDQAEGESPFMRRQK